MSKTERYDVQEDRDNDIVRHDNPNHQGHFKNELNKWEAEQQVEEWEHENDQTGVQQNIS
jgi:hypothetical protein